MIFGTEPTTKEQYMLLIGKRYNATKQKQGGDRKSEKSKAQNEPLIDKAKEIADRQGIGRETVKRAGDRAKKLEKTNKVIS